LEKTQAIGLNHGVDAEEYETATARDPGLNAENHICLCQEEYTMTFLYNLNHEKPEQISQYFCWD
jgi:hypothetical protein